MCTFAFVCVVLYIKQESATTRQGIAIQAVTVALALAGLILVSDKDSSSFNPCVTFCIVGLLKDVIPKEQDHNLNVYFVTNFFGPLVGGAMAGLFF